jgi:hypothetical protein
MGCTVWRKIAACIPPCRKRAPEGMAPGGLRGRRHRSETRGKRTQFGSAFEDCGRRHSRKNGDEVGLFSMRCSRFPSAAQAPRRCATLLGGAPGPGFARNSGRVEAFTSPLHRARATHPFQPGLFLPGQHRHADRIPLGHIPTDHRGRLPGRAHPGELQPAVWMASAALTRALQPRHGQRFTATQRRDQKPWWGAIISASSSGTGPVTSVGRWPRAKTSRHGRLSVGFSGWLPVSASSAVSSAP